MSHLPEFWSTTVAKLLVGEQPCFLSAWAPVVLKVKRQRDDDGALAVWKTKHTALLQELQARFKGDGWKLDVERYFRVTGQNAILAGKADLVCQAKDRRPLIVDAKSGKPRDSDVAQVLIEMVMIPLAWNAPSMIFDGLVVYQDYPDVKVTPRQAEQIRPRLMSVMRQLGDTKEPEPRPSRDACRFCEVPDSVCQVRYVDQEHGSTVEF